MREIKIDVNDIIKEYEIEVSTLRRKLIMSDLENVQLRKILEEKEGNESGN